jgi:A/G-specific adenine glycosylase
VAFLLERADGAVLLRKRADKGLLGGLWELPSTPWSEEALTLSAARGHAPLKGMRWHPIAGSVRHSFTHFDLELEIWHARTRDGAGAEGRFVPLADVKTLALSNLMKKALAHALRVKSLLRAMRRASSKHPSPTRGEGSVDFSA